VKKTIGIFCLIAGIFLGISSFIPLQWAWQSRWERIESQYFADLETFFASPNGQKIKAELKDHEFFFADPQVFREIEEAHFPIVAKKEGRLILKIEVFRWIHGNRYGYILQHEFFDIFSGEEEKIYEWSKTYEAGLFY